MKTSGIILELNKKQALIMTDEVGFMAIRRKPGMFIGEQVAIGQPGLKKPGLNRYYYSLGLASIAVLMSILLWGINYSGQNRLYAYVSVDINPSMEFAVNKEIRIISVKGLNNDGMALLRGVNLKNMPVAKALLMLVNKAEQHKYFHNKNDKNVLIAAAVKTEPLKKAELLAESIRKVDEKLKKRDIHLQFIQATLAQRRIAFQNNLSTGRYVLSNTATDNGQLVNLNQAKTVPISILIKKAGLITKPKAGSVTNHESFHNRATGPKVKNRAGHNHSIGSDSNSNDGKKAKNKMDSNIDHSKVKHNFSGSGSPHSGNANKSNSSSNGSNSHSGWSGSNNNRHSNSGKK